MYRPRVYSFSRASAITIRTRSGGTWGLRLVFPVELDHDGEPVDGGGLVIRRCFAGAGIVPDAGVIVLVVGGPEAEDEVGGPELGVVLGIEGDLLWFPVIVLRRGVGAEGGPVGAAVAGSWTS